MRFEMHTLYTKMKKDTAVHKTCVEKLDKEKDTHKDITEVPDTRRSSSRGL